MWIRKLEISRFRNIESATLLFNNRLNVITGCNGSGKSSILEALYCLSTGHSFRTNRALPIIKQGGDHTTIYGEFSHNQHLDRLGIQKSLSGNTQLKMNGSSNTRQSQLALHAPILGHTPESDDLIEGSNKVRLSYLDWSLFHVKPHFRDQWRSYQRAVKQRNTALRTHQPVSVIYAWDKDIGELGTIISQYRIELIERLVSRINSILDYLLPQLTISISYKRGWPKEITLSEALMSSISTDIKMGFTHNGPHRADIQLRCDGRALHETLSRGQRKLVILAFYLAQLEDYSAVKEESAVIYLDDLAAELDMQSRSKILNLLLTNHNQVILTALSADELPLAGVDDYSLFHVEQGRVANVL